MSRKAPQINMHLSADPHLNIFLENSWLIFVFIRVDFIEPVACFRLLSGNTIQLPKRSMQAQKKKRAADPEEQHGDAIDARR